jgi:hypothetical protein
MKKPFSISTLMGAAFIIVGLHLFNKAFEFKAHSIKTTGKVVAVNSHSDNAYHPVVVFTDKSGVIHTQETSFGSSTFNYKPGDQIDIRYESGTRMRVEVDGFQSTWALPIFFTVMGVIFIASQYLWLNSAKLKKNSQATRQIDYSLPR